MLSRRHSPLRTVVELHLPGEAAGRGDAWGGGGEGEGSESGACAQGGEGVAGGGGGQPAHRVKALAAAVKAAVGVVAGLARVLVLSVAGGRPAAMGCHEARKERSTCPRLTARRSRERSDIECSWLAA